MKEKETKLFILKKILFASFLIIISIWFLAIFISALIGGTGNVALIKINGLIVTERSPSILGEQITASSEIIKFIEKAEKNKMIKAIIFDINSPGGTPVASYEIAEAISKTNKTTVALIRDMGTSGAYWIASSCDYIVANPLSIVGSIGATSSHLNFYGLLQRYNITYEKLVSARYKDIGTPFREMTDDEKAIFQNILNEIHVVFIDSIKKSRKLDELTISEISTGKFYTGKQALSLNLVDKLGTTEDAISYIEQKEGIEADIVEYVRKVSLFEQIAGVFLKPQISLESQIRI